MGVMTPARPTLARDDLVVRDGPFTLAERDALPDDGYRHELLDGVLVMAAAPNIRHQDIVLRLGALLQRAAPRACKVLIAPTDVVLGPRTVLEPDVLVARRADVGPDRLEAAPLLAVEVHSPSTMAYDLGPKMEILAAAGCPSYWTIDPEQPELVAWALRDGRYVESARVSGEETWSAAEPFTVSIRPVDLLDL